VDTGQFDIILFVDDDGDGERLVCEMVQQFLEVVGIGTSGQTQESDVSEDDPGPQNKMHAYVIHDNLLVSKDESKEDWIVVENRRHQRNAGGERNRSHTVSRI